MNLQEFFNNNRMRVSDTYNKFRAMAAYADLINSDAGLSPVQTEVLQGFCLSEEEYQQKTAQSFGLKFQIMCDLIKSHRPAILISELLVSTTDAATPQGQKAREDLFNYEQHINRYSKRALAYAESAKTWGHDVADADQTIQNAKTYEDISLETASSHQEIFTKAWAVEISAHLAMLDCLLSDIQVTLGICARMGDHVSHETKASIITIVAEQKYHIETAGFRTDALKQLTGMKLS